MKNALSIGHLSHKRTGLSRRSHFQIQGRMNPFTICDKMAGRGFPGRLARPTSQEYDQKTVPLAGLVHRICFWILVLIRPNPASENFETSNPSFGLQSENGLNDSRNNHKNGRRLLSLAMLPPVESNYSLTVFRLATVPLACRLLDTPKWCTPMHNPFAFMGIILHTEGCTETNKTVQKPNLQTLPCFCTLHVSAH